MKRGYLVTGSDSAWGVPVVASTAKNAKVIAWNGYEFEFDCEYIELRVNWRKRAIVDELPLGIVEDDLVALQCKLIDYLGG